MIYQYIVIKYIEEESDFMCIVLLLFFWVRPPYTDVCNNTLPAMSIQQ